MELVQKAVWKYSFLFFFFFKAALFHLSQLGGVLTKVK